MKQASPADLARYERLYLSSKIIYEPSSVVFILLIIAYAVGELRQSNEQVAKVGEWQDALFVGWGLLFGALLVVAGMGGALYHRYRYRKAMKDAQRIARS